jgi:hypothetical protein
MDRGCRGPISRGPCVQALGPWDSVFSLKIFPRLYTAAPANAPHFTSERKTMSGMTSHDDDVYTGIWINRSHSTINGATLTLDRRSGAFLIAFLALFVGAAGRNFWKIVRFILHLCFSAESNLDGLYYQRQAILRNAAIAHDAALDLLMARFAWRKTEKHVDRRSLPVALLAFFVAALFVISGKFRRHVPAMVLYAAKPGLFELRQPIFTQTVHCRTDSH